MGGSGSGGAMSHPHQVSIPDASTQGIRSYREPDIPHPLQLAFLEADGERAYVEQLRGLLAAGRAGEAAALLEGDIAGFHGTVAQLCQATPSGAVELEGWEDLGPILEEFEGPPVTAVIVGLTNEPDLVFDGGRLHDPTVILGLYSDDAFAFSTATDEALLAECAADHPGWAGQEEDVEFYVRLSGLAELNTALVQSRHRYFLRDGRDGVSGRAPGGYVEFVLGCWFRAARFLQAVERAIADHGLPPGARLIAGSAECHTDFATVYRGKAGAANAPAAPAPVPSLTMKPWVQRPDPTVDVSPGAALRQRMADPVPDETDAGPPEFVLPVATAEALPPPKRGWLARLADRFRR